ncbi:putative 4-coumarate--CoA ligase-like 5-like protein [Tanacetum coccineum]
MFHRLKSLKMTKNAATSNEHDDDKLMLVAKVLEEVRETIISLVESLMLLMSMPNPNPKAEKSTSPYGLITVKAKFMRVNSLSPREKCDMHAIQRGIERLEAVDSAVEDLEVELESIFKRLIRTRVLLLNVLSN